jgi:hypothetical protein
LEAILGPKQQKKFRRLLLQRIKWNATGKGHMDDGRLKDLCDLKNEFDLDESDEAGKEKNKCVLLWQVRKRKNN